MAAEVEITNSLTYLKGFSSSAITHEMLRELDARTAYMVAGADHVPAFQDGFWDGKVHLLRPASKKGPHAGAMVIPTGMLDLARSIVGAEAEWTDNRRYPEFDPFEEPSEWGGPELRDYQLEAAKSVLDKTGFGKAPRGILNLPIRSGKTIIAAWLISRLGWKTTFVVESDLLLHQTYDVFKTCLPDLQIGKVGAGEWDPQWVTVATIQTLVKRAQQGTPPLDCDLLIYDEVHHARGDVWRRPVLFSDAWGKIGLSATVFHDTKIPQERSTIWVRACTGPILYQLQMKRLIAAGHLVQPTVLIYKVQHHCPTKVARNWRYGRTYDELIAQSEMRNSLIADLAEEAAGRGLTVLIDTGRLKQMNRLAQMLTARNVRTEVLHGSTLRPRRQSIIKALREGKLPVIIGTILGEGVDIPELEVVINAEGGKSRTAVMQRMRNLTTCDGKDTAIVIDFADMGQKHLQAHALARLDLYRETAGVRVRLGPEGRPGRLPASLAND